ncbi:hypothetical protein RIR_jg157.t1 [Rhizophagus irregularis DAOM 181602=DAOM 197198]|nr:hypothetical protein RIR_jg157.t1 [Rhizophagus irregularis DAOM 181602=DAOM 197198]
MINRNSWGSSIFFIGLTTFGGYFFYWTNYFRRIFFIGLTTAKSFAKGVFINQERKLGDSKTIRLTVVVLTINYAD